MSDNAPEVVPTPAPTPSTQNAASRENLLRSQPRVPGPGMAPPTAPNALLQELALLSQALRPGEPVQGTWQYSLMGLLRSVLETSTEENFGRQWTSVLSFFHQARDTALTTSFILRPGDNWPGSDQEFSLYRRLVWLIEQTADANTRARQARGLNLDRVVQGLSQEAAARLQGFYG